VEAGFIEILDEPSSTISREARGELRSMLRNDKIVDFAHSWSVHTRTKTLPCPSWNRLDLQLVFPACLHAAHRTVQQGLEYHAAPIPLGSPNVHPYQPSLPPVGRS
jgi:hypothetical protein